MMTRNRSGAERARRSLFHPSRGVQRSAIRDPRSSESGQALVETALVAGLVALIAFMLLAWIPVHRARSVATTAAYACAQFVSQSADPGRAAWMGQTAALETVNADWSASAGIRYTVEVAPAPPGGDGHCTVRYTTPAWFGGLLGDAARGAAEITFHARGEQWKADWHD